MAVARYQNRLEQDRDRIGQRRVLWRVDHVHGDDDTGSELPRHCDGHGADDLTIAQQSAADVDGLQHAGNSRGSTYREGGITMVQNHSRTAVQIRRDGRTGRRPSRSNTRNTPRWAYPRAEPPDSTNATCGAIFAVGAP